MIWLWLRSALFAVLRLFIPPEAKVVIPKIDPDAPCPSCGNCSGSLSVVEQGGKPFVKHTCNVCGARFLEKPVMDVNKYIQVVTPKE